MRHLGGDVEGDRDVGGGGLPREADGVVEENLVGSGLDDQGRQAGQVSLPARCSRRISLRPGLAGQRSRAGSPPSNHYRNPAGRRATPRLAARQVRSRHQIMVIRATGPGLPKVSMALTRRARSLDQEQRGSRASQSGARALVMGAAPSRDSDRCARSTRHQGKRLSPGPGDLRPAPRPPSGPRHSPGRTTGRDARLQRAGGVIGVLLERAECGRSRRVSW